MVDLGRCAGFLRARGARPIVIAHRGVCRERITENTLPAFEAAASEGADAIELDVRACASGELVAAHDPTLERITGGADPRSIADLTFEALRQVTLPCGARVPLLVDVLAFARARGLGVNIELKQDAPSRIAIVRAAARLLGSWDPKHAILVSSFDPAMLSAFALLAPRVPRGVLVHRTRWHGLHMATRLPLGAAAVHLERTLTDPDPVRSLLRQGFMVNVWTVNDPREARDLADLGVTGLITDVPATLRAMLGNGAAPLGRFATR